MTWCKLKQIRQDFLCTCRRLCTQALKDESLTDARLYKRLSDSITPYHCRSYDKQLKTKEHLLRRSLKSVVSVLHNSRPSAQFTTALQQQADRYGGQLCSLRGVKPAPEIFFYRNKDVMLVGKDKDGRSRTVGNVAGKTKDGRGIYVSPKYILNMKKRHKDIINGYQHFIRQSPRGEYDPSCHGYWSSVMVRSNRQGDAMLIAIYRTLSSLQEDIDSAKDELKEYFSHGPGSELDLTSVYLRPSTSRLWSNTEAHQVHGAPHIYETVLGRTFQVSPQSFFQSNTAAAEVLYSTLRDYVKMSSARSLVDVCCGTGTIGVLTSDLVDSVFGVEIVEQAVIDARINAQINGVTTAEFITGKAHRALRDILPQRQLSGDVIAVVNPGRNGVNVKVINALRNCQQIRHVVYVSCKPRGNPVTNFIDLIVPANDRLSGEEFQAREAIGVDLFPQTPHCELLLYFNR